MRSPKPKQANKSVKSNRSQLKRAVTCAPANGESAQITRNPQEIDLVNPHLYTPAVLQLEMLHRRMSGQSINKISREMNKDWATVAKVVKSEEMEATVMEMKGAIMGTWKEWLASLRRAVNLENDGEMAKFLFMAFGAIPAAPPKVDVAKTDSNSQQSQLDAYRMRAAIQLGLVALERAKIFGSSLPLEREELEKLMEKS